MSTALVKRLLAGLTYTAISFSLWATPSLTNGSFESHVFPSGACPNNLTQCNIEFDNNYNYPNVVTGWAATGYSIYFITTPTGNQYTQSAVSRWSNGTSGSEMLDTNTKTLSPNGGDFVGLDGDPSAGLASTISQTITVSAADLNKTFYIQFYWATSQLQSRTGRTTNDGVRIEAYSGTPTFTGNNPLNACTNCQVDWTSTLVNTSSGGFDSWRHESVAFKPTSTTETIKFLALSASTCLPPMILLDGIQITTPEPGAILLALTGFGALAITRFRKRRSRSM